MTIKYPNCPDYEFILSELPKYKRKDKIINIQLLSNFNHEIISNYISFYLKKKKIKANIYNSEYDQVTQEILHINKEKKIDFIILLQDMTFYDEANKKNLIEYLNYFLSNIYTLIKKKEFPNTNVIVNNLSYPEFLKNFSIEDQRKISSKIIQFNNFLKILCKKNKNIKLIDFERIFLEIGLENLINHKLYFLYKSPYNEYAMNKISKEMSKLVNSFLRARKKCLVIDLDNTLWGGVLGEVGYANIDLNKSLNGKKHIIFQNYLINLSNKGILLAICSKNNMSDIRECFNKNKEIKIKLNNFSSIRANWSRKSLNIVEISKELNIGLDSMVFLDDSKFEQEEVKRNLPDVEVLNVSNVNDFIPAIEDSGLFFLDKETKEDKKKTLQYKIIQKAQNLKLKVKSQDEYLKKLKMILYISRLNQNNFDRSLQLINKVNQFNLTNIRFDNRELTNFLKKKENIGFIARLKDKFGDNGLTALVMGKSITNKKYEIINFLLSCRILGRNVEKSLLSFFLNYLKKQGVSEVEGKFNKTKKNIQCKDFYILNGFTKIGNKYSINLNRQILKNNTQHIIIKNEKN